MSAGIDIGIDAQGCRGLYPSGGCNLREHFAFFFRFQIKLADPFFEAERQFLAALANAGKHNVLRLHPCCESTLQFATGNDVRAIALIGQYPKNRKIGIRFHREREMDFPGVLQAFAKYPCMPLERRPRIDIDRSPDFFRDF